MDLWPDSEVGETRAGPGLSPRAGLGLRANEGRPEKGLSTRDVGLRVVLVGLATKIEANPDPLVEEEQDDSLESD